MGTSNVSPPSKAFQTIKQLLSPAVKIEHFIGSDLKESTGEECRIRFKPKDYLALRHAFAKSDRFFRDMRNLWSGHAPDIADPVGFREGSRAPLHAVLSEKMCDIHIDEDLFASDLFRGFATRMAARGIKLADHVRSMIEVHRNPEEGIDFLAADYNLLISELNSNSGFARDDQGDPAGWTASWNTRREGYKEGFREYGSPAMHVQIGAGKCNLHLDPTGFLALGKFGPYYNPDAIQHIGNDLAFAALKGWVFKQTGLSLDRINLVLPNSSNNYAAYGVKLNLWAPRNKKLESPVSLDVAWLNECKGAFCVGGSRDRFFGLVLSGGGR